MAVNYIRITTTNTKGGEVITLVDAVERAFNNLPTVVEQMNALIDGSNYTALETNFGVPTGQGQTFYNLVVGLSTALNTSADVQQAIFRLG